MPSIISHKAAIVEYVNTSIVDVPIAFFILMPHKIKNGTLKTDNPINVEIKPR